MKLLIGNTGLIGKTLKDSIKFDIEINSSNINELLNTDINNYDLYLSCLPATKWIINKNPIEDYKNLLDIYSMISKYHYNKIILFSTIDVYSDSPFLVDETYNPNIKDINYGSNRYTFELLVSKLKYNQIQIFRLPALFGNKIKKNILFDLLNNHNIDQINFNSTYQWFNLDDLFFTINNMKDISGSINLFSQPLDSNCFIELFNITKGNKSSTKIEYNYKTKYSSTGYIKSSKEVFEEISRFVHDYRNKPASI